jgi:sister chromatid cohesion protein DCC1
LLQTDPSRSVVPTIRYFSRNDLPTDPLSRFNELFLTRSKWQEDDIVAFLEDIAVDKKDCDRLLLKFSRRSTGSDGVVYFTARAGHM